MRVFESKLADPREKRLTQYALARFPDHFADRTPEEMTAFCLTVRVSAGQMDVTEDHDVATVLDLVVMYGPHFYEAPWASDVFAVPDWSGAEKMRIIRSRVRRQIPEF